jgi:pentapeptide MXKDX repeat protein
MCLCVVIAVKAQRQSFGGYQMKKSTLLSALFVAGLTFTPLAPAAFADDTKKDTMSKDNMSKDSMKKDSMSKDSMSKEPMKKDNMSKDSMSKDDMKK